MVWRGCPRSLPWREPNAAGPNVVLLVNADGTGETRLARGNTPSWSPDGKSLVYQGPGGIYVIGSDGSRRRTLTRKGGAPDWSPDGREIVFEYNDGRRVSLHVINSDGTGERLLVRGPAWRPKWSPAGDAISYDNWDGGWVLNLRSRHVHRLEISGYHGSLAWSPDGRQIVWPQQAKWPNFDLWVMNRDGSARHRLARTPLEEDSPDWSP